MLGDHLLGAHLLVRGSPSSARARLGATEPGQRSAPGEDEVAALSCGQWRNPAPAPDPRAELGLGGGPAAPPVVGEVAWEASRCWRMGCS